MGHRPSDWRGPDGSAEFGVIDAETCMTELPTQEVLTPMVIQVAQTGS
jgi:hypothetical protein